MSTETILNIMVVAVALNTIASARFNNTRRQVKAAEFGAAFVITTFVTGLTMLGLWVWLAVATGHWQFAAIIAIPMLITIGSLATRQPTKAATR